MCIRDSRIDDTATRYELTVRGGVFALDGSRQLTATASGSAAEAADLGARISDELFAGGAAELLGK